eukprot:TRINITY_DN9950_c0_g1_i3.p1 TRINITY_DN9950_c0_g1~~TRINITY_DN9950_c0_g1_i3.p1  ORF type:complete len:133 (+),score=20.69 TRINITY_DN9950_c0_g1_i3:38-436(+)
MLLYPSTVVLTSISFLMAITYLAIGMRTHYLVLPMNIISFLFIFIGSIVWVSHCHEIIREGLDASLSWSFYGSVINSTFLFIALLRISFQVHIMCHSEVGSPYDPTVGSIFFSNHLNTRQEVRNYGTRERLM